MTVAVAALYIDPKGTLARRFWSKVDKNGPVPAHRLELGPCWVWTASTDRKGYGQIMCGSARVGKKPQRAHRISWMLQHGELPELCVLHACDNPRCVRPDHLFVGTVAENNADMTLKGRLAERRFSDADRAKSAIATPRGDAHYARTNPERLARGERHPRTRITAEQVQQLRRERAAGVPLRRLATKYGLSEPAVSAIARRRNWRHVP